MVTWMFRLNVSNNAGVGGSALYLSLPVTPASTVHSVHGSGTIYDQSSNTTYAGRWGGTANNIIVFTGDWSGGGSWGSTPSIGTRSGDSLSGIVTIEVNL
jgi:hypothetical protein